jgi:hypothetical protein
MAISNIKLRASTTAVSNLKANVDASINVKSSPLTHEEVDLNFLELAEAVKNKSISPLTANLDAGTNTILNAGNIAIGTSTVGGVLTVNSTSLTTSAILTRTGLTSDDMFSPLRVKSKRASATNMGDNFGSSISFQIEDDGATGSLGYLGFKRVGNDSTGKFSINTYTAGTPAENLTLTAAGVLTVSSVVADLTGSVTGTVSSIANHNTGNLAEGSNLYFTNARADARISASSINALSDVDTSGAANGKILKYNGTSWVVADDVDTNTTDISANTITQLSDVTITSATNGQVLKYNGSAWVNGTDSNPADTDALTEGSSNLYFTNARAISAIQGTNLDMGTTQNITNVNSLQSNTLQVDNQVDFDGPFVHKISSYGQVGRHRRTVSSGLNTYYSGLILEAKGPSPTSDGFGPVVEFELTDDSGTSELGYVGFVRDGADNSGKFIVAGNNAGTTSTKLSVDKNGTVDVPGKLQSSSIVHGVQNISGPGAISLTETVSLLTTTGTDAYTLADGTEGQIKIISMKVNGGNGTVTPTNFVNGTSIVFNDVEDTVTLLYQTTGWVLLARQNATVI